MTSPLGQIGERLRNTLFPGALLGRSRRAGLPVVLPHDRWPGDSRNGAAILAGEWHIGGTVHRPGGSPWNSASADNAWLEVLHGFEWLRDLRVVGGGQARSCARQLTADWLQAYQSWDVLAWRAGPTAQRLCNWLSHFQLLTGGGDDDFRYRLMQSIDRQSRHLLRTASHAAPGLETILVARGLIYCGICLAEGNAQLERGSQMLEDALAQQILADGGHLERAPGRAAEALRHLVDLNQLIWSGGYDLPPWTRDAIEKLATSIRFFRHGDGRLALFNGGLEDEDWRIDMLLAQTDTRGRAPAQLPQTGFQRLHAMRMLVFVDCGFPPPRGFDQHAHAGPLAMEVSLGRERIFVNCGAHAGFSPDWRYALRGTAAHTTITINDTNSCTLDREGGISRGPRHMRVRRQQDQGNLWLHVDHDGYRPQFGLSHHRRLFLVATGERLLGEDVIIPTSRQWVNRTSGHSWQARFHLHPDIRPELVRDDTVLLHCAGGTLLRFRTDRRSITLAPSVYSGSGAPRETSQLAINGPIIDGRALLKWSLEPDS